MCWEQWPPGLNKSKSLSWTWGHRRRQIPPAARMESRGLAHRAHVVCRAHACWALRVLSGLHEDMASTVCSDLLIQSGRQQWHRAKLKSRCMSRTENGCFSRWAKDQDKISTSTLLLGTALESLVMGREKYSDWKGRRQCLHGRCNECKYMNYVRREESLRKSSRGGGQLLDTRIQQGWSVSKSAGTNYLMFPFTCMGQFQNVIKDTLWYNVE